MAAHQLSFREKFRKVFVPFWLVVLGIVSVYVPIFYLYGNSSFCIQNDTSVTFAIPIIGGVLSSAYLLHRFKIVFGKTYDRPWPESFMMLAGWLGIGLLSVIVIPISKNDLGSLTALKSFNELNRHILSQYFTFQGDYLHSNALGVSSSVSFSNKNGTAYRVDTKIAYPLFDTKADTAKPCAAWLVVSAYRFGDTNNHQAGLKAYWEHYYRKAFREAPPLLTSGDQYRRIKPCLVENLTLNAIAASRFKALPDAAVLELNEVFYKPLLWVFGIIAILALVLSMGLFLFGLAFAKLR